MENWFENVEDEWRGLHLADLHVDQAFLYTESYYNHNVWPYFLSDECYSCPYERSEKIVSGKFEIFKLDTAYPLSVAIFDRDLGIYAYGNETSLCNLTALNLGEFGVYNLTVVQNGSCNFQIDKDPVNTYLPIAFVGFLLLLLGAVAKILLFVYRKNRRTESRSEREISNTRKRLDSLDTFRGITITFMIFVNSGAGHYWWMEHATWNGLHVADLVFPSFLWIMGTCIPLSIKSQLNHGVSKRTVLKNIFWRSVKLFLIGLCLNSINGPKLESLRIMGVLQRFGITYFVSASAHTVFNHHQPTTPQRKFSKMFYDVFTMKYEWLCAIILVGVYLLLTFVVNIPGCPRGYLGPGGKHNMASHPECTGGIAGFIDKKILSPNHIYQHSTAKHIYDSVAFDPEGIFGSILSTVEVIIGVQCGIIIIMVSNVKSKVRRWIMWSLLLAFLGGILCSFSKERGWIPINKNLWSLSFVCVTSSFAIMSFVICYFIIDVRNMWSGAPFKQAGMNSIIMYVGHTVLHKMLPWHWQIGAMNTHFLLLLESVWNTGIWIVIAVYLYKKKIFYNL